MSDPPTPSFAASRLRPRLESRELGWDGPAGSGEDGGPAPAGEGARGYHDGGIGDADVEEDVDAPPSIERQWMLLAAGVIAVVVGVEGLLRHAVAVLQVG